MKKLATLLLSVGMLFSMAACSSPKVSDEALDKLETSFKKFSEVSSASYDAGMEATMNDDDVKVNFYGGFITETKKPLQFSLAVDMEASGEKIEKYMQFFMKDDVLYLNLMNMVKQKTSLKEAMGATEIPNMSFDADTININKEEMKEYLTEASVSGNNLKLSFDVDKINKEVKAEAEELGTTEGAVEFKKLDMDITLNNDFMEKAIISMDMTVTEGEQKQDFNGNVSFTMKEINKLSKIDFPDFTDYTEDSTLLQ